VPGPDHYPLVVPATVVVAHIKEIRRRARERRRDTPSCVAAAAMESAADELESRLKRASPQLRYNTAETAQLLGFDRRQKVTYRYRTGRLKGQKRGGELFFTEESIREYLEDYEHSVRLGGDR